MRLALAVVAVLAIAALADAAARRKADLGRIVTNYEILAREDIGVQVDGMRTLVKLHSSKFQLDWDLRLYPNSKLFVDSPTFKIVTDKATVHHALDVSRYLLGKRPRNSRQQTRTNS
jgi:hypothetical protein